MMRKRKYGLDLLRIAATLFVLCHHYQQLTGAFWPGEINYFGTGFELGVLLEFFFVLSGYVIYPYVAKLEEGMSFKDFYLKRYLKLLPGIFFSSLAFEAVVFLYRHFFDTRFMDQEMNLLGVIINSLGMQEGWVFASTRVNNPLWYISVLLWCYIVMYAAVRLHKKNNIPLGYLLIALMMCGCAIHAYGFRLPFLNEQMGRGYISFFMGLLLAYCEERHSFGVKVRCGAFAVLVISLGLIVTAYDCITPDVGLMCFFMSAFVYVPAIILFSAPVFSKIPGIQLAGSFGNMTLEIYLYHLPVLGLLMFMVQKGTVNADLSSRTGLRIFAAAAVLFGVMLHLLTAGAERICKMSRQK